MLKKCGPPAKPELKKAIDKLLLEDTNFDRYENRSLHRESLVRAVQIDLRDSKETIQAFSRNVSAAGIGVITHERLEIDAIAVLSIAAINGEDTLVLAECRWCKPFGAKWFLSGWQFIGLQR